MERIKLLLVEDDNDYRIIIKDCLEMTGEYIIHEAKNGWEGYETFKSHHFDIIVTDIDMPKVSGLEMVDLIRKDNKNIPILIASGMTHAHNINEGFKHDIDNYIKKPYTPEELDGVIKALFKRMAHHNQMVTEKTIIPLCSYLFDIENRSLNHKNKNISLSKREAQILYMLYRYKDRLVKRNEILKEFWGAENDYYQSRCLDVFINKLRRCLKEDSSIELITIRGEGYILNLGGHNNF